MFEEIDMFFTAENACSYPLSAVERVRKMIDHPAEAIGEVGGHIVELPLGQRLQ